MTDDKPERTVQLDRVLDDLIIQFDNVVRDAKTSDEILIAKRSFADAARLAFLTYSIKNTEDDENDLLGEGGC